MIDGSRVDLTRRDELYDLVFDVPGNRPLSSCRMVLDRDGLYVLIGHDAYGAATGQVLGSLPRMLRLVALSPFVGQLPTPRRSRPPKAESLAVLGAALATGKLTPMIDRTYSLSGAPAALVDLVAGRARGRLVITSPA